MNIFIQILLKPRIQSQIIIIVSIFFCLFDNFSFFSNVLKAYPFTFINTLFILSLFVILLALIILLFTLLSSRYTTKPLLVITLLVSSFTSYFMITYNIVIDDTMIQNVAETNINESLDLLSIEMVLYILFLGILPSIYVYKVPIKYRSFRKEMFAKLKASIISTLLIAFLLMSFSKFYASFFREHKPLRYYTNPTYWMYSIGKYTSQSLKSSPKELEHIGNDASIKAEEHEEEAKELVILVVGETARADRFSLNGYEKETNPLLKQEENIINFSKMSSCGTSTAVSVPCMFSVFDKDDYDYEKGVSTENILDVLVKTNNIEILWRDNNSDSKGVAIRVPYEDFKTPENNPVCDIECRDVGMLAGLDEYIEKHKGKDILIVLHMMGNHGPAYYKRYPKEFEKFTPVCETNQLEKCSKESISNAYDNAILYTDYFLSEVIKFLKPYSKTYETGMIYMSDHGESLGENGLYLHGMPYFMAPEEQIHVASLMWFDGEILDDIDIKKLKSYNSKEFSQDNIFHSLLGLFEVEKKLYKTEKDMFKDAMISE